MKTLFIAFCLMVGAAFGQTTTIQPNSGTINGLFVSGASTITWAAAPEGGPAGKKAEHLTSAEIEKLADAEAKLKLAQQAHDATLESIKDAHGQNFGIGCAYWQTLVTIWGDYALVSTEEKGGCIAW